jgi:hypothetical protein
MDKFTHDLKARLGLLDDCDTDQFSLTSDYVPQSISPKYVDIFDTDYQPQSPGVKDETDNLSIQTAAAVSINEVVEPSSDMPEFISDETESSQKIQKLSTSVSVFHLIKEDVVKQSVEIKTPTEELNFCAEYCITDFPFKIVSDSAEYVPCLEHEDAKMEVDSPISSAEPLEFLDDEDQESGPLEPLDDEDQENGEIRTRKCVILYFANELDKSFHPTGAEAMRLRMLAFNRYQQQLANVHMEKEDMEVDLPAKHPVKHRERKDVYDIVVHVTGGKFIYSTRRPLIPLLIDLLSLVVSTARRIDDPGPWEVDRPTVDRL